MPCYRDCFCPHRIHKSLNLASFEESMHQSGTQRRRVLLICDSSILSGILLSLYDRMNGTSVTVIRRKYSSCSDNVVRASLFPTIQIPLTMSFGFIGGRSAPRDFFNAFSYLVVGSFVGIMTALRYRCTIVHSHFLVPQGIVGLIVSTFSRSALVVTAMGSDVNIYSRNTMMRAMIRMLGRRGTIVSVSRP